jgi:hypothetical protein
MKKIAVLLAVLVLAVPALAGPMPGSVVTNSSSFTGGDPPAAGPVPVSYFTPGPEGSFSAFVYPSTPTGDLTTDTGPIALPSGITITPGFLVLVNNGLDPTDPGVQTNQADWAQVLEFFTNSIELFSAPGAFPSVGTVLGSTSFFQDQSVSGPSVFLAGSATYNVFSPGVTPAAGAAPEPVVAIVVLTLAASGLTLLRRPY